MLALNCEVFIIFSFLCLQISKNVNIASSNCWWTCHLNLYWQRDILPGMWVLCWPMNVATFRGLVTSVPPLHSTCRSGLNVTSLLKELLLGRRQSDMQNFWESIARLVTGHDKTDDLSGCRCQELSGSLNVCSAHASRSWQNYCSTNLTNQGRMRVIWTIVAYTLSVMWLFVQMYLNKQIVDLVSKTKRRDSAVVDLLFASKGSLLQIDSFFLHKTCK